MISLALCAYSFALFVGTVDATVTHVSVYGAADRSSSGKQNSRGPVIATAAADGTIHLHTLTLFMHGRCIAGSSYLGTRVCRSVVTNYYCNSSGAVSVHGRLINLQVITCAHALPEHTTRPPQVSFSCFKSLCVSRIPVTL